MNIEKNSRFLLGILMGLGFCFSCGAQVQGKLGLDDLRLQRRQKAFKKRPLILNNDGCDVLYYPRKEKCTPEGFLKLRTTALANTQVGTISYCSISSGFSNFTHDTKVGTVLEVQPADHGVLPNKRNVTRELIDQGADCLKLVVDYAHAHNMEAFWSMRMNDTHDVGSTAKKLHFLYPPLKVEHPDWLLGEAPFQRTKHGRWSSVNYALPEIRDLAFRYIEEVCRNYDVDGVELDYFRHLGYFKSVINGGVASDGERAMLTGFMKRVRSMTEAVGMERGRPIVVAIRVPDSVEYCRDMGFDLETWMRDGLFDALITTGYFRLNSWKYTVDLAHKYNIAAWPGMSESRIRGETRFRRKSIDGYRARATNAWFAGADGLYYFNSFNPNNPLWKEVGSLETMCGKDKLYFVNIRDGRPDSWLNQGVKYQNIEILSPGNPRQISPEEPLSLKLMVAEDFATAAKAGFVPQVTACANVSNAATVYGNLIMTVNGRKVEAAPKLVEAHPGWVDFPLDPELLKRGENRVGLQLAALPAEDLEPTWNLEYRAGKMPVFPWISDRPRENVVCKIQDDSLLIADRGTKPGDYRYFRYPWQKKAGGKAVIEAEVKIISGTSSFLIGDGVSSNRVRFFPDRVESYNNRAHKIEMDTTDAFHTYRIEIEGEKMTVSVDGELRLSTSDFTPNKSRYALRTNSISFGAASSGEQGEALWRSVRIKNDGGGGLSCNDFALQVNYSKTK